MENNYLDAKCIFYTAKGLGDKDDQFLEVLRDFLSNEKELEPQEVVSRQLRMLEKMRHFKKLQMQIINEPTEFYESN